MDTICHAREQSGSAVVDLPELGLKIGAVAVELTTHLKT